ncbi:hypothetical protein OQJ13_09175 [Legionella sp. PATHC035]|uniref:hypothetical protein n=1 Tax=Legionella sp. PATHC035 TaxID=2992040 RepID=UPI0022438B62|nr:hypothetical protein [Legionella sp. PATHC035]MCW8409142.1 hypothetical protein [Legionella sp. PATHC035]
MHKMNLVIQVQGEGKQEQYFPAVRKGHEKEYAYVRQLAVNPPEPVENTKEQGETLRDIIHLIEEDNKQLLHSYDNYRTAIFSTARDEELTHEQLHKRLRELYIKYLPQTKNTVSVAALEQSKRKPLIADAPEEGEEQTIKLLANALSDWITTKQVDPDTLFDELEKRATVGLTR